VQAVCAILDKLAPNSGGLHARRIKFFADRPGHDLRYAVATDKIRTELGWQPRVRFERGLRDKVAWYLGNRAWWEPVLAGSYKGERLGLGRAP
jgi:dTDP-glucose 4,6-dehydratase